MAFLAFAEPGNAGYARVTAARGGGVASRGFSPYDMATHELDSDEAAPMLTELERSVIGLARADGMATLRQPGRLSRWLGVLFGVRISPQLADPRLEALRRIAVLSWRYGYAIASAEVKAFMAAGYTNAFYEMVVDTIASARLAEQRRGR